ncbi:MAG TPA: hypothetical protein VFF73_13185 [Planctomycetota bacterium]|nr:hypothetical protein [Planctomycetota bacterium]
MLRASLALVILVAGCAIEPRTKATKEIFVEPFKEAEIELARLDKVVPFPCAPADQPRACCVERPFEGESQRSAKVATVTAPEGEKPVDPKEQEKPPTALLFPERADARPDSGCYLGHCLYLDRSGTKFIHHLRLLVVNREKERVAVPVGSFAVFADAGDRKGPVRLDLLIAATDRSIKIPDVMEVPPGEQRVAHFFYVEKARLSPILEVRWTALVADPRAAADRVVTLRADLCRRYVCEGAPLSPLEERIGRGDLNLPEPGGTRNDWIDPGLSAVPGVGR